jgi:hypothetical protein
MKLIKIALVCLLMVSNPFFGQKINDVDAFLSKSTKKTSCYLEETITRSSVFEKNEGKCYLCEIETHLEHKAIGYEPNLSTVDHIIPISKGGSHTWENVRNCCLKCNITKHDRIY